MSAASYTKNQNLNTRSGSSTALIDNHLQK